MPRLTKRHLLMIRWGAPLLMGALVIGYAAGLGNRREDPAARGADGTVEGLTSVLERKADAEMARFTFEEVAETAGLRFRHFPATRRSLLPEDMGSGVAWGDYDGDGDPDLFLVNFRSSIEQEEKTDPASPGGRSALFRNEGGGRFKDMSGETGLDRATFGMGAAWGDYDNDGDLDLYLTNYGANILYRNNENGTFTDVTASAGAGDAGFSAGCGWADYDRDGWIDLYVCNYVEFEYRPEDRKRAARHYGSEVPYTINPSSYPPASNRLYHNNGDGTFSDVAGAAGVTDPEGRSLSAAWFDFDLDGWVDLYVANDVSSNAVFRNKGDGTFEDIGAKSLAADYRGAMGLGIGDFDGDGDLDLFVTHWLAQENAFFENMYSEDLRDKKGRRRLFFMDGSDAVGLGQPSLRMVGWATGFADFDNDGALDLWVANGNTLQEEQEPTQLKAQQMQIFRQKPPDGFFPVGRLACAALAAPFVGRGGAQADYDGDGKMDIAVLRHGDSPLLLHNTTESASHWVAVRLRQSRRNTQALGARVQVRTAKQVQIAQVASSGPYLSQHSTDLHFGLAGAATIDELTITWPDGARETHKDVPADRIAAFTHEPRY